MPKLRDGDCYRIVKTVDVSSLLPLLAGLQWFGVQGDPRDPNKPPCSVALSDKWPQAIHDWIEALDLGGSPGRYIIRKLAPGQHIPVHTDAWMPGEMDWRRFQVPLVTHPGVIMRWPEQDVSLHLEAGRLYEVRYDTPHEVIQGGDCDRIHLQIDQVAATI